MSIFIVDDSVESRILCAKLLEKGGYEDIHQFASAQDLFSSIHDDSTNIADLIILDIMMPEMDGITACSRLKQIKHYSDVPVIMVTAIGEVDKLKEAFDAGASDYVTKPVHAVELLARVRAALKIKSEIDQRRKRELQLEESTIKLKEMNRYLERISMLDSLTGIANRRYFDEVYEVEWKRALRSGTPLSLVFADIDFFKKYNDEYGHLSGDECLKTVTKALKGSIRRGSDFVARFGGEEFVVLLPGTEIEGAVRLAEVALRRVYELKIPHCDSPISESVTISLGVASLIPNESDNSEVLIEMADNELYRAKANGRNRVVAAEILGGDIVEKTVAS